MVTPGHEQVELRAGGARREGGKVSKASAATKLTYPPSRFPSFQRLPGRAAFRAGIPSPRLLARTPAASLTAALLEQYHHAVIA